VLTSSGIRDPNRQRGFLNTVVSRLSMSAYSECPLAFANTHHRRFRIAIRNGHGLSAALARTMGTRRETKGHVRSVLFQTVERGIVRFDGAIRHAHIVPQINC
jgi:hypothetical protein